MLYTTDELVDSSPATRARLIERFRESSQIIYVANTTARAQLVTGIADWFTPSSTSPLYVHRGDAGAGRHIEYTLDGATWVTVPAYGDWVTVTPAASWSADTIAPRVRHIGDQVELSSGRFSRTTSDLAVTAGTLFTVATIPTGYRPSATVGGPAVAHLSSDTPVMAEAIVLSTGELQLRVGSSGTISATSSPRQSIGMMRWPRV